VDALETMEIELGVQMLFVWDIRRILLRLRDIVVDCISDTQIRLVIAEIRQKIRVEQKWRGNIGFEEELRYKAKRKTLQKEEPGGTNKKQRIHNQICPLESVYHTTIPNRIETLTFQNAAPLLAETDALVQHSKKPSENRLTPPISFSKKESIINSCVSVGSTSTTSITTTPIITTTPSTKKSSLLESTTLGQYMVKKMDMNPTDLLKYFHSRRAEHCSD